MRIVDLASLGEPGARQAARVLFDAFIRDWPDSWPTLEAAEAETRELLGAAAASADAPQARERRVVRAAVEEDGSLIGWAGAIPEYGGRVWEIHPLAVAPARQRGGVGTALMRDLERLAAEAGGVETLWLGSDDESGLTSLGGEDLYPDPLARLAELRDRGGHPFVFYRKLGYAVAGVLPDANGFGKPDIFLAKRVGGRG